MIGMAVSAAIHGLHLGVGADILCDLFADIYVTLQAQNILGCLQRQVTTFALSLELGMRIEPAKRNTRTRFGTDISWAKQQSTLGPEHTAQNQEQGQSQAYTKGRQK